MLLTILFWVILVLAIIGLFVPVDTWPYGRHLGNVTIVILFILIGLKIFRTPLG